MQFPACNSLLLPPPSLPLPVQLSKCCACEIFPPSFEAASVARRLRYIYISVPQPESCCSCHRAAATEKLQLRCGRVQGLQGAQLQRLCLSLCPRCNFSTLNSCACPLRTLCAGVALALALAFAFVLDVAMAMAHHGCANICICFTHETPVPVPVPGPAPLQPLLLPAASLCPSACSPVSPWAYQLQPIVGQEPEPLMMIHCARVCAALRCLCKFPMTDIRSQISLSRCLALAHCVRALFWPGLNAARRSFGCFIHKLNLCHP